MKKRAIYKRIGSMIGKLCQVPMTKADDCSISIGDDNKPKLRGLNNIDEFKICYLDVIKKAINDEKNDLESNPQDAQSVSSDIYKTINENRAINRAKRVQHKQDKKIDVIKAVLNDPDKFKKYKDTTNSDNKNTNDNSGNDNNNTNNNAAPTNNDNDLPSDF